MMKESREGKKRSFESSFEYSQLQLEEMILTF